MNKFVEIYTSINEAISINNNIIKQKNVCRNISIFILFLSLFFIIDLYNLAPLTQILNIAGINITFCNINKESETNIPFPGPYIYIMLLIVNPIEKPLKAIVPYTIGMPIIVAAPNHKTITNIILEVIDFFSKLNKFIPSELLIFVDKSLKYVSISWICVSFRLFINITPIIKPTKNKTVTSKNSLLLLTTKLNNAYINIMPEPPKIQE